jgi:hypothetical protein
MFIILDFSLKFEFFLFFEGNIIVYINKKKLINDEIHYSNNSYNLIDILLG